MIGELQMGERRNFRHVAADASRNGIHPADRFCSAAMTRQAALLVKNVIVAPGIFVGIVTGQALQTSIARQETHAYL